MFTEQQIINYYDECEVHYKMNWKLDKCLAMHYGYADEANRSFEKSLLNMNHQLAKRIGITENDYVLDAGCGVGGSSIYIAKNFGCKAHGITLAGNQVASGTKNAEKLGVSDRVQFSQQSYLNTNFPDETFDVVWAIESICHAPDKSIFFNEAYRVLKPGGRIVVSDYIKEPNLTEEQQSLIDKWLHCWAIEGIATEAEKRDYLSIFENVTVEDLSEQITPSAKHMYKMYYLGYVFHRMYDLIWGVSKESEANFQSAKYQYLAFKKKLWRYKVFTAVKK